MPEGSKSEENNLAMIAQILGIVIGFIGPLIVYLTAKDKPYAYSMSKEALNFQITVLIAWVASGILSFIGIGFVLYGAVWIVNLVFCIIAAMAASGIRAKRTA